MGCDTGLGSTKTARATVFYPVDAKAFVLERLEAHMDKKLRAIVDKLNRELAARDKALAARERGLAAQAKGLAAREKKLAAQEKKLAAQEKKLAAQEKKLAAQGSQ